MNPKTFAEAERLFAATKKLAIKYKKAEVIIAPPVVFLHALSKGYRGSLIEFASQNIFWEAEGSFTGEISPAQVRDTGATHAIIGHAERRAMNVTDENVHRKVAASITSKLNPIIAVGERQRDPHGEYIHEVRHQITTALADIPVSKFRHITIAYEPIWAIGAPEAPDAHSVHQMMLLVKKTLADTYGDKAMKRTRVMYGGAVNSENARAILNVPDLDGVLVGRASLDSHTLEAILKAACMHGQEHNV